VSHFGQGKQGEGKVKMKSKPILLSGLTMSKARQLLGIVVEQLGLKA
jgi:hypothetical protein